MTKARLEGLDLFDKQMAICVDSLNRVSANLDKAGRWPSKEQKEDMQFLLDALFRFTQAVEIMVRNNR